MQSTVRDKIRRRAITFPAVVVGAPVLVVVSPVLVLLAVGIDLITGPRRRRVTRLVAMAINYVLCEWVGVMAAFALWIATGFGLFMASDWSRNAHAAVQRWWTQAVLRAAERWLGADLRVDATALVLEGPTIVAARHASFIDAVVPSVVLANVSATPTRHVLKRELAWDPCLDIYGHRHANHFVDRASSGDDLSEIRELASTAGDEPLVIFPEGTFRTARRAEGVMERFAEREPERAARLPLDHLLPPRPGGIGALMEGRPDADLMFIGHTGFEPFGSFRSIYANVPFRSPVEVKVWRVAADDLPETLDARLRRVDDQWLEMDDWIGQQRSNRR